jgi:hypothetical protein
LISLFTVLVIISEKIFVLEGCNGLLLVDRAVDDILMEERANAVTFDILDGILIVDFEVDC